MQLQLQSSHDMLSKHVTEAELVLFFFCSSFEFPLIYSRNREQFFLRSPAHILHSGLLSTQDVVYFFHPKLRMDLVTNLQLSLIRIYHIQ